MFTVLSSTAFLLFLGLFDRLLCTYQEDKNGTAEVKEVYHNYMKDIGLQLQMEKPIGKVFLGKLIKKTFPLR